MQAYGTENTWRWRCSRSFCSLDTLHPLQAIGHVGRIGMKEIPLFPAGYQFKWGLNYPFWSLNFQNVWNKLERGTHYEKLCKCSADLISCSSDHQWRTLMGEKNISVGHSLHVETENSFLINISFLINLVHTERTVVFFILVNHIHGSFLLNLRNLGQQHEQYLASLPFYTWIKAWPLCSAQPFQKIVHHLLAHEDSGQRLQLKDLNI